MYYRSGSPVITKSTSDSNCGVVAAIEAPPVKIKRTPNFGFFLILTGGDLNHGHHPSIAVAGTLCSNWRPQSILRINNFYLN